MTALLLKRTRLIGAIAATLTLVALMSLVVHLSGGRGSAGSDESPAPPAAATPTPTPTTGATTPAGSALKSEIDALRNTELPGSASADAPIPTELRQQPDLYARAFVAALLTQDYRTPRAAKLAWVQAESAQTSEPLVIGLVPEDLRSRLAVYSVSTTSDGPAPVPAQQEWDRLAAQRAYTTVQDIRVSQPLAWSNAVDAGRITDPGVTGREVTARVVLHLVRDGKPAQSATSVTIAANFEGPPTRDGWGFVTAVTYTAIPEGMS